MKGKITESKKKERKGIKILEKKKADISEVKEASRLIGEVKKEVGNVFYGHENVVDSLIRALLCDGHVLLEGVPGIAKTLVIKTLSKVIGCTSKRIQFTVDLLPTDIVGLTIYDPKKGFEIEKGPIFANFIIADEINRAPPKTQSALIEAMQEKQVTIGKTTFKLPNPFFVMANENPLETEGVYVLPEAQIDRFIFKINFGYPEEEHEIRMMEENVTLRRFEDIRIRRIINPAKIIHMQKLTGMIYLDNKIKKYIMEIIKMTRSKDFKYAEYIELGASPRATIALFISAKAEALLQGRDFVLPVDVKRVAHDVLRHRLILTYRAQAEGINADKVIDYILGSIKIR